MFSSTITLLSKSERLFNTGKFNEAYALLSDFENIKKYPLYDIVSINLFKTELLFQQGRYKEVLLTAKNTYQNSLELGEISLRVDALIWMARALIFLNKLDEAYQLIIKGEKLLTSVDSKTSSVYIKSKGFITFVKGYFYSVKGEIDQSLVNFSQSLSLRESLGNKHEISESLSWIVIILCKFKGRLILAKNYAQRSLDLAKQSAKKFYIAFGLISVAGVYTYQGNMNKCIPLFEESLTIFRELNNKRMTAMALNNTGDKYRMRGDLDRALSYLEQGIGILLELDNLKDVAMIYDYLVQILIEKGDINKAKAYLHNLKLLRSELKDLEVEQIYLFLKALLLKKSLRISDKAKAEIIFNQLLEQKSLPYELSIRILTNLCEFYLYELKVTNNLDVLKDINPLITKLIDISKKLKSYWILSETYLLQAKLSLLTFDIKKSQNLLTKARDIAESYGIKLLAIKISHEHDKLIKKINLWGKLKDNNASVSKRFEFAGVTEQMESMLQKKMIEDPKLPDEIPVLLLILSKGGVPILTRSFIKNDKFEDHLFGGFFSAINSFTNEMFSEGLERASFGNHTLLIKETPLFLTCYLYKGQSYSAQKRLELFNNKLRSSRDTWDTLKNFYQKNRIIQKEDIPSLEQIIMKIFINKNSSNSVYLIQ